MTTEAKSLLRQLSADLGLSYEPQDWGISNADGARTSEFVEFFDMNPHLPSTLKFEMGELILASANEELVADPTADIEDAIEFIKRHKTDFDVHVKYWQKLDDPEEFPISTRLREI